MFGAVDTWSALWLSLQVGVVATLVALYASGWAAHSLYAMIGDVPALAAFVVWARWN